MRAWLTTFISLTLDFIETDYSHDLKSVNLPFPDFIFKKILWILSNAKARHCFEIKTSSLP